MVFVCCVCGLGGKVVGSRCMKGWFRGVFCGNQEAVEGKSACGARAL